MNPKYKKCFLVFIVVLFLTALAVGAKAVDTSRAWHPLAQIASDETGDPQTIHDGSGRVAWQYIGEINNDVDMHGYGLQELSFIDNDGSEISINDPAGFNQEIRVEGEARFNNVLRTDIIQESTGGSGVSFNSFINLAGNNINNIGTLTASGSNINFDDNINLAGANTISGLRNVYGQSGADIIFRDRPLLTDGLLVQGGSTFQSNVNLGGNRITNLQTPSANADAVNKEYVDTEIANKEDRYLPTHPATSNVNMQGHNINNIGTLTASGSNINFDDNINLAGANTISGLRNVYGPSGADIIFRDRPYLTDGLRVNSGTSRFYGGTIFYNNVNMDGNNINSGGNFYANAYYYTSDEKLKSDIKLLENSLEKITLIDGVEFKWVDDNETQIGVVAQNIEEVFPEVVKVDDETNKKSVQYANLIAPIIEAVKELDEKNKEMEDRLREQEEVIKRLTERIERLENN